MTSSTWMGEGPSLHPGRPRSACARPGRERASTTCSGVTRRTFFSRTLIIVMRSAGFRRAQTWSAARATSADGFPWHCQASVAPSFSRSAIWLALDARGHRCSPTAPRIEPGTWWVSTSASGAAKTACRLAMRLASRASRTGRRASSGRQLSKSRSPSRPDRVRLTVRCGPGAGASHAREGAGRVEVHRLVSAVRAVALAAGVDPQRMLVDPVPPRVEWTQRTRRGARGVAARAQSQMRWRRVIPAQ